VSPWELCAAYLVLPVLIIGGWLHNRYETDGASVPEFEAWCKRDRPVLFAVRCLPAAVRAFSDALRAKLGSRLEVEHHAGRFPWTIYVFWLAIEEDEASGVVRVRARRGAVRRKREHRPDLAAILEGATRTAHELDAVWLHTELREGDEFRGEARRGRGWLAVRDRDALGAFTLAGAPPAWVQPPP
jgi:hypothetical protein